MRSEPNAYSPHWFEFFHVGIDDARTARETEFVCSCAPQPDFRKILDVCCGMGRHARALSQRGYAVTGTDRDSRAMTKARDLSGGPDYILAEIREYQPALGAFDAAIMMGQSFGHFDHETNLDLLRRLAVGVRKRGRIILDLWNPEFFAANQGERDLTSRRGTVRETKRMEDGRLLVELNYPDRTQERFEWQLFTPKQMERLAKSAGLDLIFSCSGFNTNNLPLPADPRIQFVLERAR